MLRRIRQSPRLIRAVAAVAAAYVRLVERTTRWQVEGLTHRDAAVFGGGRALVLVWHSRVLMLPTEKTPAIRIHAMISANRDGDLIADIVGRFGVPAIRGSAADPRKPEKDKGGRAVARAAIAALEQGAAVAITPDGPRGPRERMQPGVAALAILARASATPYACATRRAIIFPSWDRFMLPLPFGRGAKVFGLAVPPPEARGPEAHRLALEAALAAVTARADALAGRRPAGPA